MSSDEPIPEPAAFRVLKELRLPLDALRWTGEWPGLAQVRAARRRTVLLLPGIGANEHSLVVLRGVLRRAGHDVHDWGLGRNTGNVPALREAVLERVSALGRKARRRVVLVGWSLGGYIAREAAREQPERVRKVVTLGSPVVGGPRYTAVAAWYRARGHDPCRSRRSIRSATASSPGRPASIAGRATCATSRSTRPTSGWCCRRVCWRSWLRRWNAAEARCRTGAA